MYVCLIARAESRPVAIVSTYLKCAGEPISTRWTSSVKTEIKDSRVNVTRSIVVRYLHLCWIILLLLECKHLKQHDILTR